MRRHPTVVLKENSDLTIGRLSINVLLCMLLMFVSCSKSDVPDETTYLMTVKEYKTNIPLPGVKISLYKCSNYDWIFGCLSRSVFATRSTDQNGEYVFKQAEFNQSDEGIVLSKSQYFDADGGEGERFMQPEARVLLALKATTAYPDTSFMELDVTGELGFVSSLTFRAPRDSIVNFRLFGNQMNEVNWVLYTTIPPCIFYCPRDTLAFGSLSLNPEKFETLTSSINY